MPVGMEVPQENDYSVKLTQEEFAKSLEPIPTSPGLWDSRQRPLSCGEIKLRRRTLEGPRWLTTATQTHCARLPTTYLRATQTHCLLR